MNRPFAALGPSLAVLTLAALSTAPVVQAAIDDTVLGSETVQFRRIDLLDASAVKVLYHRLERAAQDACRGYESRDLERQALYRGCVADSVARAVAQIHDPGLTAYHAHRPGPRVALAAQAGESLR